MKPEIDRTLAPILLVRFPPEVTSEEVTAHFDELRETVREVGRVAVVVDLTEASMFSPALRKHGAEQMKAVYAAVGSKIAGVAHIITSAPIRGALTAMHWLSPPPFRSVVVSAREEALEWARSRLG